MQAVGYAASAVSPAKTWEPDEHFSMWLRSQVEFSALNLDGDLQIAPSMDKQSLESNVGIPRPKPVLQPFPKPQLAESLSKTDKVLSAQSSKTIPTATQGDRPTFVTAAAAIEEAKSSRRRSRLWRRSGSNAAASNTTSGLVVSDPKPRDEQYSAVDGSSQERLLSRCKQTMNLDAVPRPRKHGWSRRLKVVLVGDGACGKTCMLV